jgi:hypothetical protein
MLSVSVGGWPGPSSRVGSHHSITRAICSKMLSFNTALLVTEQQMGTEAAITKIRLIQPRVVVKTASYMVLFLNVYTSQCMSYFER